MAWLLRSTNEPNHPDVTTGPVHFPGNDNNGWFGDLDGCFHLAFSPAADWRLVNSRGRSQTPQWLVDTQNLDRKRLLMIPVVTRFGSCASGTSPAAPRRVVGEFMDLFQLRCGQAAGEAENLKRQKKTA
jgi:hypothetical protein